MKEILMEIEILRQKMEKHDDNVNFPKLIYAITGKITRSELFNMTEQELITHIQKIQIIES